MKLMAQVGAAHCIAAVLVLFVQCCEGGRWRTSVRAGTESGKAAGEGSGSIGLLIAVAVGVVVGIVLLWCLFRYLCASNVAEDEDNYGNSDREYNTSNHRRSDAPRDGGFINNHNYDNDHRINGSSVRYGKEGNDEHDMYGRGQKDDDYGSSIYYGQNEGRYKDERECEMV